MKKALKALMTLGGAALAVVGGVFVYRRSEERRVGKECSEPC